MLDGNSLNEQIGGKGNSVMENQNETVTGSQDTRSQSTKFLYRMLSLATSAGLVVGLGYFLRAEALQNEGFNLVEVEVQGAVRSRVSEVIERSGLRVGTNLFALNTIEAEQRLSKLGWVRAASVRRIFPDQVVVVLEEHEPVALAALEDLFYVDRSGRAFRAYVPGEVIHLPIIVGLDRDEYERRTPVARSKLKSGLRFLVEWRSVFGSDWPNPRTIEVGDAGVLSYVDRSGVEVFVGPSPWREALLAAREALRQVGAEPLATMYVGRGRRSGRVTVQKRDRPRWRTYEVTEER